MATNKIEGLDEITEPSTKSRTTTRQQPTMMTTMTTRNKPLNVSALTLVICYMLYVVRLIDRCFRVIEVVILDKIL